MTRSITRLALGIIVSLAAASASRAANDVWDNNPGGNWGTNANWADNSVPGLSDTATFSLAQIYAVTFAADPLAIQDLTVSAGIVTFQNGGSVQTLDVTSGGGALDAVIGTATLNLGTAANTLAVNLTVGDDVILNSGGTLNINAGSLVTVPAAGDLTINSNGTVNVGSATTTGRLIANGDVTITNGDLAVAAGSTFTLAGGTTMTIQSGGAFTTANNLGLGTTISGGSLSVQGVGSTVTQSGATTLTVGHATTGTAAINIGTTGSGAVFTTGTGLTTIRNTATVNVGSGAFAGTLNVNGDITIDGGDLVGATNSTFALASEKTMTIENSGSARLFSFTTASNAIYDVTGNGSELRISSIVDINNGGQVHVASGGQVVSTGNTINIGTSGNGTLTVDGSGSSVSAIGTSRWGRLGSTANVTFSDSASGTFSGLVLADGNVAGTMANVDVLSGADLTVDDLSLAEFGGTATLNLQSNGSITQNGASTLTVGHASSGTAAINIGTISSGTSTSFTTGTGLTTINATGTLNSGGGTTNVNCDVLVDGGQFIVGSQAVFNFVAGKTLTVQNGGSADFNIGIYTTPANSVFNVTGNGSVLETSGFLLLGAGAELNITQGGSVIAQNFVHANFAGTILVDGPGSSLTAKGIGVGTNGQTAHATFSNEAQCTCDVNFGVLQIGGSAFGGSTGVIDVLSGADITAFAARIGTVAGAGDSATLNIDGPGSTITISNVFDAVVIGHATAGSAALNIGATTSGATFTSGGDVVIKPTGAVTVGSGSNTGTFSAGGNVTIDDGRLEVGSGSSVIVAAGKTMTLSNTGTLRGSGSVTGNVVNTSGVVGPGTSPGELTINGNYTQGATGTLVIELAGTAPGSEYDRLLVSGNATLAGTLDVDLLNGFTLSLGDSFEIVDVGGVRSGTFSALAEGAVVGNFGGTDLFITYAGGDGNDVALFVPGLPGDHNHDGSVDTADYVMWRKADSGNAQGYADWAEHFGEPAGGSGGLANATSWQPNVPEPAAGVMLLIGLSFGVAARWRQFHPSHEDSNC